jgi:predicted RNA binding protein YcfA (HicA-like mRNA interferase family)
VGCHIEEVRLILPDLLELLGHPAERLSLTFIAEEHLDLALGPRVRLMADFYKDPLPTLPRERGRVGRGLREHSCQLVRTGKGSHEIWQSPINDKPVVVPRSTKSRHTANDVLKQAGIPKAF